MNRLYKTVRTSWLSPCMVGAASALVVCKTILQVAFDKSVFKMPQMWLIVNVIHLTYLMYNCSWHVINNNTGSLLIITKKLIKTVFIYFLAFSILYFGSLYIPLFLYLFKTYNVFKKTLYANITIKQWCKLYWFFFFWMTKEIY